MQNDNILNQITELTTKISNLPKDISRRNPSMVSCITIISGRKR